jgi:hypothetical protein
MKQERNASGQMIDRDRMIELHLQMLAELGWILPTGDWVDAWAEGEAIGTDEAAYIGDCSQQTVRRRAVEAQAAGEPIGILFMGVWLISRRRWLDDIEGREGRLGRDVAKARMACAEKCKFGRTAPKIGADERAATG